MAEMKDLTSTVDLALTARLLGRSRSTSRGAGARRVPQTTARPEAVASRVIAPPTTGPVKLRPSMLAAQLRGSAPSTLEKHKTEIIELLNMSDYTHQTSCAVDVEKPIFEPLPSIVEFRQYAAFAPVEARISFRNNDTVPRRMRVVTPDSPFFAISGPRNSRGQPLVDSRVAPGTELHYTVTFTPREVDAYLYDLVVVTEREKFLVPLRSQGTVGVLSFPDSIAFASTPVKSTAVKTFVVRNTGSRGSEFAVYVPPHFTVTPERGFVDVDQNLPVTVEFTPVAAGPVTGDMVIAYADGFSTYVALLAAGHDVEVGIDAHELAFPGTYTSLTNSFVVNLTNRSDIPATFVWRACKDAAGEAGERSVRLEALEVEYESARTRILEASDEDIVDVDGDGVDDLSESDEDDKPPAHARRSKRRGAPASTLALTGGYEGKSDGEGEGEGATFEEEEAAQADPFLATRHLMATPPPAWLTHTIAGLGVNKRTQLEALRSRYRSMASVVASEGLDFASPTFTITPATGTVWSQSSMEFTVVFAPNEATTFDETAWLEVSGRTHRAPLRMTGPAYGPKLTFTYDVVDVGDVFLTSQHRYEVVLLNKGEIAADWAIKRPMTKFGRKFSFEPSSGHVDVGGSVPISVVFTADELGGFEQSFKVQMKGNVETMRLFFKGAVVGPSFTFDVDSVYFGRVPFDFTMSRRFTLYNTSDVAFTYTLRVPQDGQVAATAVEDVDRPVIDPRTGKLKKKKKAVESVTAIPVELLHPPKVEFEMTPSRATIAPGGLHNIQLDFTTGSTKRYDGYSLTVDVDGVGQGVLSIPIIAESTVATVEMVSKTLDMGEVYLRHPYSTTVVLRNTDKDIPARFKVLPVPPQIAVVANVVTEVQEGSIPPNSTVQLTATFTAFKVGVLSLPVTVEIQGAVGDPLRSEVLAKGRGPKVVPSTAVLDFGGIPALKEAWREIVLTNESTINAPVQLFMRGSEERFHVDVDEAVLPPGGKKVLRVRAMLDDTTALHDELVVNITESEPLIIPVKATGMGSTLSALPDFLATGSVMDLGQLFTSMTSTRTIVMTNKGQRTQTLSWINTTQRMKELAAKKDAKKKGAAEVQQPLLPAVFLVEPAFMAVKPKQSAVFTVTCVKGEPGEHDEEFELSVKAEGDIRTHTWATPHIRASFVQPLLKFSAPELLFEHEHSAALDVPDPSTGLLPLLHITKTLGMTNVSALPLDFTLRCAPPFSLDAYEFTLRPGESCSVTVGVDPLYRDDRASHSLEGKITAVYREHPRRDSVKLHADLRFPNLALSRGSVEFGCVLNDTTSVEFVQLANTSSLPVDFAWAFVDDPDAAQAAAEAAGLPYVPVNQVFDILPLRGHLEPGESASIQFVFYGHPGRKFDGLAVCEVAGGPDYEMSLAGEASIASYRLDKTLLALEPFVWDRTVESDFHIFNTGKVEYAFNVSTEATSRPGVVAVVPASGVIPPGGKARVKVAARPGLPGPMREQLVVTVAHFDPVEVAIVGEAIFSVVTASLPLAEESNEERSMAWETAMAEGSQIVETRRAAVRAGIAALLQAGDAEAGHSTSSRHDPIARWDALHRAGKLLPEVNKQIEGVLAGQGYSRTEGGVIPLAHFAVTTEVEAEAARIVFARHIVELTEAERRVADAEVHAGVARHHPNLTTTMPAPLRAASKAGLGATGGLSKADGRGSSDGGVTDDADGYSSPAGDSEDGRNGGGVAWEEKKDDPDYGSVEGRRRKEGEPELATARAAFRALPPPADYQALRYVVDLGHVVLGTTRKRSIAITSSGRYPASVSFNKLAVGKSTGFKLEPGKITRLPEGATTNLDVVYDAQPVPGSTDGLGLVEVVVPLQVSKGPAVALILRANITVPDLRLSPEILDFHSVFKGQEKVVTMQLHNISPVPASWEFGVPSGAPAQIRDKDNFTFTPRGGTLQAGERCMVRVAFQPSEGRGYGMTFPLKLHLNPRPRTLLCRGKGADVPLSFQVSPLHDLFTVLGLHCPSILAGSAGVGNAPTPLPAGSLGDDGVGPAGSAATPAPRPGLPPSAGGTVTLNSAQALAATGGPAPTSKTAKAKLKAAKPEALVQIGPQLPRGVMGMRLVRMTNGSTMPVEVVSLDYDGQAKAEHAVMGLLDAWDEKGEIRVPCRAPGQAMAASLVRQAAAKDPSAAAFNGAPAIPTGDSAGQLEEAATAPLNSPRALGRAVNVVVLGPPGCGASTQASALGSTWRVPVVTLDGVLAWARSGAGGASLAARISAATAAANKVIDEERAARNAKGAKVVKDAAPLPDKAALPVDLVADALASRAGRLDAQVGIILDGVRCSELDGPSAAAAAVRLAFTGPKAGALRLALLRVAEADVAKQLTSVAAALTTAIEELDVTYVIGKSAQSAAPPAVSAPPPTPAKGAKAPEPAPAPQWVVPVAPSYTLVDGSLMGFDEAVRVRDAGQAQRDRAAAELARVSALLAPAGAAELSAFAVALPKVVSTLQGDEAAGATPSASDAADVLVEVDGAASPSALTALLHSRLPRRPEEANAFNTDFILPEPTTFAILRKPAVAQRLVSPEASSKFRVVKLDALAAALTAVAPSDPAAKHGHKSRPSSAGAGAVDNVPLTPALTALLASGDFESMPTEAVRWALQPGETAVFGVRFASTSEGDFTASLHFGVVDVHADCTLLTRGVCVYPGIESDASKVYAHKQRVRAEAAVVTRRLIQASNVYEFGALLAGRQNKDRRVPPGMHIAALEAAHQPPHAPASDLAATTGTATTTLATKKAAASKAKADAAAHAQHERSASPTRRKKKDPAQIVIEKYFEHVGLGHCETLRITNTGQFPATVRFGLAGADVMVPYQRGTPYVTKPEAAQDITAASQALLNAPVPVPPAPDAHHGAHGDGHHHAPPVLPPALEVDNSCFVVEPCYIPSIPVGESVEVSLWAFPKEGGDHGAGVAGVIHRNTLVVHVKDNPTFLSMPISAVGATPFLKMSGPWEPATEKAPGGGDSGKAGGAAPATEPAKAAAPAPAAAPAAKPGTAKPGGKPDATAAAGPQPALAPDGSFLLDFERTLVNTREDRTVTLTNAGLVPLVWRISEADLNASALAAYQAAAAAAAPPPAASGGDKKPGTASGSRPAPHADAAHAQSHAQSHAHGHGPAPPKAQFFVSPVTGTIEPGGSVPVIVSFGAAVDILQQGVMVVEYADAEGGFEATIDPSKPAAGDHHHHHHAAATAPPAATSKPGTEAGKGGKPGTAGPADAAPAVVLPTGFSALSKTHITVRAEAYQVQSQIRFEGEGIAPAPMSDAERIALEKPTVEVPALTPEGKPVIGWDGLPVMMRALAGADGKPLVDVTGKPMPAPVRKTAPGHFDFGIVRVNDTVTRVLPLSNDGKYPIAYKVGLSKADVGADLFAFTPAQGVLEAGQTVKVEVAFCAKREVRMKHSKLLLATISDARSGALVDSIPVLVTAESVFSKWSVSPSAGLNFGAIKYAAEKERRIEIRNVGVFPFDFHVVPLESAEDVRLLQYTMGKARVEPAAGKAGGAPAPPARGSSAGARPGTQQGAKPGSAKHAGSGDGPLGEFGRFLLPQTTGTVTPGTSVSIPAKYVATGAQAHHTTVRVHITGFDFVHGNAEQLVYELVGESCVPGINASDWPGVFEEQMVTDSLYTLAQAPPMAAVSVANRKQGGGGGLGGSPPGSPQRGGSMELPGAPYSPSSSFASLPGVGTADSAHTIALVSRTRSGYATTDKTFTFGSVITTLHPKGVTERIKISNPTKIPVSVKFAVSNDASSAFTVTPALADIPVHDSVYVTLRFHPTAVKKYNAVFSAEVDGGTNAETRRLEFGITGDGALPTAAILDPTPASRDPSEGMLVADLGKVQVSRARTGRIAVRNDGVFPSVVKFELPFSRVFRLLHLEGGSEANALAHDLTSAQSDLEGEGADALNSTMRQDAVQASKSAAGFMAPTAVGGKLMSVLLQPGARADVGVIFAPDMDAVVGREEGAPGLLGYDEAGNALYAADVRVSVLHNPFEAERVRVKACASLPDLAVENVTMAQGGGGGTFTLRGGKGVGMGAYADHSSSHHAPVDEDCLHFPDLDLSSPAGATASFTLVNRSERPLRFQMPGGPTQEQLGGCAGLVTASHALSTLVPTPGAELVHFAFSPQAGHLPIGGRRTVSVTFRPAPGTTTAIHLADFALPLYYSKVTYEASAAEPASKERAVLLAEASGHGGGRPVSGASSKASGKDKPKPAPAAAAPAGKGAPPAKPGTAKAKAGGGSSGAVYTKRRPREPPATREPRHEWESSQTAVTFMPVSSTDAQTALADGMGELMEGGVTVKVTTPMPEPAYAVLEALPAVAPDSLAAPPAARPPSSKGTAPGAAAAAASKAPTPAKPASAHGEHGGGGGATPFAPPTVVHVAEELHALLSLPLHVKAVADKVRYELVHVADDGGVSASRSVSFSPTLMFASRVVPFAVKNPGAAALAFSWALQGGEHSGGAGFSGRGSAAVPFTVEPDSGVIRAGESQTFKARFCPMEAAEFECTARMDVANLSPTEQPLMLTLSGLAQRPIVHMDITASEYLSRREGGLPGPTGEVAPLEAGIRVVELPSLGVGVRNVKKFYIINPTDAPYEFAVEGLGIAATPGSAIRCVTPRGLLLPGKRFEVVFEFTPVTPGVTEAFFRFAVPSHNLSQLVLAAGVVSEPRVHFDRVSLSFKNLLVGNKGQDTVHLINSESVPFAFSFATTGVDGDKSALTLVPAEGVVPAGGRVPIEVTLSPREERQYNLNVACTVKRRSTPLHLNVKGEGYAIHDRLQMEDSGAPGTEGGAYVAAPELTSQGLNFLDFGTVQVNERGARKVVITNNGAFSFDFHWSFSADGTGSGRAGVKGLRGLRSGGGGSPSKQLAAVSGAAKSIRITPEAGRVPKGASAVVEIEFRPTSTVALAGLLLSCTVANTKQYRLSVSASGGKPSVEFSAQEIEFGECFIPPSPSLPAIPVTKTLKITNKEDGRDVSLQCLWDRSSKPYLTVGMDAMVLRAGESVDVPFTFNPRTPSACQELVVFEINGVPAPPILVKGEGVVPDITLTNAAQVEVSLGAMRPGQTVTRVVKLSNKSKRNAVVELVDERITALPSASRPSSALQSRPATSAAGGGVAGLETVGRLASHGVTLTPTRLLLKARDTTSFEIKFTAKERVAPFKEPLHMKVGAAGFGGAVHGAMSLPVPLLSVSGACLGMDVMLEADTVMFGKVCESSKLSKAVQLYNTGDVPARFKWDVSKLGQNFTLVPAQGFLSPQSDVQVTAIFHPTALGQDIRVDKVALEVEGRKEPLLLTLAGDCVGKPTPTGAPLAFSAKVREAATANITLPKNETDRPWTLTPVFSSEFYTGPATVEVPAKGAATFAVTYKPVVQTKDGGPATPVSLSTLPAGSDPVLAHVGLSAHTGTVFFALPDGTGVSYCLTGKAAPGALAGTISGVTPAKKTLVVAVPVDNALRFTQRYVVSWDAKAVPASALLKGARTHDVPGLNGREYKLSYTPSLEGRVTVPLTFTSEATGEALVYEVHLEAGKPGLTGSVHLESTVRQSVSAPISIPNPLAGSGTPVTFAPPVVDHPAVRVTRVGNNDGGAQEILFRVDYRPLVPSSAGGGGGGAVQHKQATPPPSAAGKKPGSAKAGGGGGGGAAPEAAAASTAHITLHSDQLGDFTYELALHARTTGPEPTLRFTSPLGGKQHLLYRLRTFDGKAASYKVACTRPDVFVVPPTLAVPAPAAGVDAWDGVDTALDVAFEGLALGDAAGELTLTSEATGTVYLVPLHGSCTPPRPAGPFDIAPGGTTVVEFRNVFSEDKDFAVGTDPLGVFSATPTGVVKVPKKCSVSITVKYDPPVSGGTPVLGPVSGRLMVSCPSVPELPAWLYYLRGGDPAHKGDAGAAPAGSKPGTAAGGKKPGK